MSDTHSFFDNTILKHFEGCDEIWHAGDFGVGVAEYLKGFSILRGVYGNIDGQKIRAQFPQDLLFNCEAVKVFITHIGGYPGNYETRIKHILQKEKPDLFISGHSHIVKIMRDPKTKMLFINPGAAGKTGFHLLRTIVHLKIEKDRIFDVKLIEIGKRAAQ